MLSGSGLFLLSIAAGSPDFPCLLIAERHVDRFSNPGTETGLMRVQTQREFPAHPFGENE
jgi:hypothetical protein